jgi:hypothetical protein
VGAGRARGWTAGVVGTLAFGGALGVEAGGAGSGVGSGCVVVVGGGGGGLSASAADGWKPVDTTSSAVKIGATSAIGGRS